MSSKRPQKMNKANTSKDLKPESKMPGVLRPSGTPSSASGRRRSKPWQKSWGGTFEDEQEGVELWTCELRKGSRQDS